MYQGKTMHIPALSYPGPLSKLRATTSPHHFACSSRSIVLYILSNSTYREHRSKPHTSLNLRTHTGQTCRHPMTSPRNVCETTAFCGKKKEIIKKEKERKRKEKNNSKERRTSENASTKNLLSANKNGTTTANVIV